MTTIDHPRWIATVVRVEPHNGAHWVAVRASLTMAISIIAVWQLGHLDWALYVAFGAFASVYGRHATYGDRLRMQSGAGATIAVSIVLGTAVGVVAPGSMLAVGAMTVASGAGFLLSKKEGWLPVGSLFFVFGAGATSSFAHPASDIPLALALAASSSLLAIGIGQLGRFTSVGRAASVRPTPAQPTPAHPSPVRPSWSALLGAPGVRWELARYAAGPLVAGGIATLVGIGHPYWAAVSATVPLAGASLGAQMTRAAHRLAGTLIGVAVAVGILLLDPSDLVLIVIVVVLQAWAELFVLRNYGLTVVGLTPLALLLSHLASPAPIDLLATDRALETALGVVVAVTLVVATRSLERRRRGPADLAPGSLRATRPGPR